jgi:exosortase
MTELAKHQLGFVALWAVSLLVGWRALVGTFSLSSRNDQYTYLLLIFPVSAALIVFEWRAVRTAVTLNVRMGFTCLVIAVLIACSALGWPTALPSDVRLSIKMLALVLWWIGSFLFCFGSRASRFVLFPLCFLLGLVPLPQLVVNAIVGLLQQGSAWAAQAFFAVCGVPVAQDGVLLTIPGLTLQVSQECSSIRSSSMLLVTTMVLAQLLLRSPWRKALVIGLAVPLSVAKNGLRIFTIAMLGTRVDPAYLTGRLHHEGGIVFFAIILLVIFALIWILRRFEDLPGKSALSPLNPDRQNRKL